MTDATAPTPKPSLLAGWFATPLWIRIVGAMILGALVGLGIGDGAKDLKIIGDVFVEAIRMLVVPLIFATITAGVVAIGSPKALGRTGGWTIGFYVVTSVLAVCLGLLLGSLLQPGAGLDLVPSVTPETKAPPTWQELLLGVIPENPVKAMAEGQALPIIVFAVLFGLGLLMAGDKAKPTSAAIDGAAEALLRLVGVVMELAPFGVFALMAFVVGTLGVEALVPLLALVGVVYLALFLHATLVYGSAIKFLAGLPVLPFYRGMLDAMAVAYSTSSSNATLPVTMRCCTENLGVPQAKTSFVTSLGATIHMDGTAIYLALVTTFGAQVFGVELGPAQLVMIVLTATLGAIGAAGVPGGSFVMMPLVLGAGGVPLEVIPIILAVDRVMDMARTVVNVLGDATCAVAVSKWDGDLDEAVYRGRDVA
jgi:Na+/H+-dicarboxylate symporter